MGQETRTLGPVNTTITFIDDTGFTVQQLPPGWLAIDHNNTSREEIELSKNFNDQFLVDFCPPGSKTKVENLGTAAELTLCDPIYGSVYVDRFLDMDKNENLTLEARGIDPETGLIVLNLTADDVISYTTSPEEDMIVQTKDLPVNITNIKNGTTWQVPGKLVLFTSPTDNVIKSVGLYFVDHTSGYAVTYDAPAAKENNPTLGPDPRGEPIPIYGIGLDNLPPPLFDPVMQILKSVSIQRR
jgi:hypothetical protein